MGEATFQEKKIKTSCFCLFPVNSYALTLSQESEGPSTKDWPTVFCKSGPPHSLVRPPRPSLLRDEEWMVSSSFPTLIRSWLVGAGQRGLSLPCHVLAPQPPLAY